MERWTGKIAVVTGASAGIGLAIAQALVKKGMVVIGLARRKAKMQERMKGIKGKFYACECDVSNEQSVNDIFQWIKKNVGVVQVLVNNAGIGTLGSLIETSREDWEKVINVNVMGVLTCAKLAAKMMKEANIEGHIVNINSIAGHRVYSWPNVKFNIYTASKYAVTAITETLQNDLLGDKIKVTSISPGVVKTEMFDQHNEMICLADMPVLNPEDIAEAVIYVIGTPQRVQVTELTIKPLGL